MLTKCMSLDLDRRLKFMAIDNFLKLTAKMVQAWGYYYDYNVAGASMPGGQSGQLPA